MNFEPRLDCRHYTGYKPCHLGQLCAEGCEGYEPQGKRVLIVKLGAMGDVLRTTPVLRALRRLHEPCWVTWLTLPESEFLLCCNPLVDRVLTWGHDASLVLRAERFDLLLDFEKEPRALALDARIAADEKRGFALSPSGTLGVHNEASLYALRLGIDDELKFRQNRKSMPEILFEMAELPYAGEEYVLEPTEEAREFGRRFVASRGLSPERPTIGLNTGCGSLFPTKQWPAAHFVELIGLLAARTDAQLLLLGGERERAFNAVIARGAPAGALLDAGCGNTIEEFIGLVSLCDLMVSADSLGMHLAIALRKKTVALMGPTSATEIALYGRGETLASDCACMPCYRQTCTESPTCMEALTPSRVFETIIRWLPESDRS